MKNWMKNIMMLALILSVAVWNVSCTDEEAEGPGTEEVADTQDESVVASTFDEVEDLAFSGILATGTSGGRTEEDGRLSCATVNAVEEPEGIWTVTIDFGEGCTGPGGRTRAGIIQVTHNGNIWLFGSTVTVELIGYSVNGVSVEGTRTVSNITTETSEGVVHQITLTGGKVTWSEEDFVTREVNRTRTWIRAISPIDDQVKYTGTASGKNRRGREYTSTVKEEILLKRNCANSGVYIPVSGVLEMVTDRATMMIDYGDGACDRKAVVTMNGRQKEVTVGGN